MVSFPARDLVSCDRSAWRRGELEPQRREEGAASDPCVGDVGDVAATDGKPLYPRLFSPRGKFLAGSRERALYAPNPARGRCVWKRSTGSGQELPAL